MTSPLLSPAHYEIFIYSLPDHYPIIKQSSLVYIPRGVRVGKVEGLLIRIPAPNLTFTAPNLPFLIREVEETLLMGR